MASAASEVGRSADRRALGAYYTDSDVARYLCVNTLLPWLLQGQRLPLPAGAAPYRYPSAAAEGRLNGETEAEYSLRREHAARVAEAYPAGSWIGADEGVTHNLNLPALIGDWARGSAGEEQVVRLWRRLQRLRVLDPTCGDGAFLMAALHVLEPVWEAVLGRLAALGAPESAVELGLLRGPARRRAIRGQMLARNLFGVDVDPGALSQCARRLLAEWSSSEHSGAHEAPRLNLHAGNSAAGVDWESAFPEVLRAGGFDVVVGNPPYLSARSVSYRPAALATSRCPNVYAWVAEQAFRVLAQQGRSGLILPVSAVSGPEYRPLAQLYQMHDCWISTYSNRPAKLFEGVEQRLAIQITGPVTGDRESRLWTTVYQHWYEAERPRLFESLHYVPGVRYGDFPAKLGHPLATGAFLKLQNAGGALKSWEGDGPAAVWLHDGPTYWVRALPFRPNTALERPSSHYHRIAVASQEEADLLAAVLSSSTFYFWFKAVSNCRDLGRQEWESFPIGEMESGRRQALAQLGRELGERLRSTARRRQRKYPAGTVVYEEYYPSLAVDVLDRVDEELARHYGLTEAEGTYLRDLDRKYRLGRNGRLQK